MSIDVKNIFKTIKNDIDQKKEDQYEKLEEFRNYILPLNTKSDNINDAYMNTILPFIFKNFYVNTAKNNTINYITPTGEIKVIGKINDLINFLINTYGEQFFVIKTKEKNGKQKKINVMNTDRLMGALLFFNQYNSVRYRIDYFKSNIDCYIDEGVLHITRNQFKFHLPDEHTLIDESDSELFEIIIEDYKNHFPELDEFLEVISYMPFNETRRASYIHFNMCAEWGKSGLLAALQRIGAASFINIDELSNTPTGIDPMEVFGNLVIVKDEFKIFKKEYKEYNISVDITPKFQSKYTVDVYTKVLLSAETSKSFEAADEQIIDRVSQLTGADMKITERPIYRENKTIYWNVITMYMYYIIKTHLNQIKEMGRYKSAKKADEVVTKFHEKYKIKSHHKLEDVIKEKLLNFLGRYTEDDDYYTQMKKVYGDYLIDDPRGGARKYYLINADEFFLTFINKFKNKNFVGAASYKSSKVAEILGIEKPKTRYIKALGRSVHCLYIDMDELLKGQEDDNE